MKRVRRLRKPKQNTWRTRPSLRKNPLQNLKNQRNNRSYHTRTLILVKCNKFSEEICKPIVNVVFVGMCPKQNAFQKNASVASTFICVQARKNNLVFSSVS